MGTPDRPIFILGPPRSGTTLIYRCFGSHPEVGYFNRANRKLPHHPKLAHFLTRAGLIRDSVRESRAIWDRFFVDEEGDERGAADATPAMRTWYERLIGGVLAARGATRFASKLPAHSVRVPWLNALFPEAIYVLAMRDWRAVVASTVTKRMGKHGGEWFGVRPRGWRAVEHGEPERAAVWQFLRVHEILGEAAREAPERFLSVQYEELCLDPEPVMRKLLDACDLPYAPEVIKESFRAPSDSWKKVLDEDMIDRIRAEHGDALRDHEYEPRPAVRG